MNYQKADEYLGKKTDRPIGTGRATRLVRHSGVPGDSIHLKLHDTYVVTWYADGRIELNSGGWRTVTTKARINEHLERGYGISQVRGQWYLTRYQDEFEDVCLYDDGLIINPDDTITGGEPIAKVKELLALRRRVNRFATAYALVFSKGKVPMPGPGDCFYCGLREVGTGKPLGECAHNPDHLISHLDEKYYVPSILLRAMETMPVSKAFEQTVHATWQGKPEYSFFKLEDKYFQNDLKKTVSRYMLRQLGQAA